MHVPIKRSAALLGASAVFALAGCGSSSTQSSTGSAATGTSPAAAQAGGAPSAQLKSLADALGVSVAKLHSAMQATRPTAGSQPSGDRSATLAKALGISQAKVRQAMQSTMPQGGTPPPSGAAPLAGSTSTSPS
jgi:hypothetical protein